MIASVSALNYWNLTDEEEEAITDEEEDILDRIFDNTYHEIVNACKAGKISDDNVLIGAILSLMERIIPRLFAAYKSDPEQFESICLGTASALRVTIGTFMPFSKFMEIQNRPGMVELDRIVEEMIEKGEAEARIDELVGIFKNMKVKVTDNRPDIYG